MAFDFPYGIDSICSLSDILEDTVAEKYFLSEKSVAKLMEYNERNAKNGNGFKADFTKPDEIKNALKVGGGGINDLVQLEQSTEVNSEKQKTL